MRTNIEIDDKLMAKAMEASRLEKKTKKAIVEEALELLVRSRAREGLLKLRGKVRWEGDLEAWRQDRELNPTKRVRTKAA